MLDDLKLRYAFLISEYHSAQREHKIAENNLVLFRECRLEATPEIGECDSILRHAKSRAMARCDSLANRLLTFVWADLNDPDLVDAFMLSIEEEEK